MTAHHFYSVLLAIIIGFSGCQKTAPTRVERLSADEVTDLSGAWNDTDSKLVSAEMVQDMLSRRWLQNHLRRHSGTTPSVIVGYIRNLSHEHVNVETFVNDIERELINSGEIDFVANSEERQQLRFEREDQDLHASETSRKAMGQELGADYMMIGSINTLLDGSGKIQVTYYQVDIKLLSLTDNRTVWVGQKKIKKLIENGRNRY